MADSNYPLIIAGLVARLQTLVPASLKNVLDYEPNQVGATPMVYLRLERLQSIEPANQELATLYVVRMRLVVEYGQNQKAEQTVASLIPTLMTALGTDLTAGDAIVDGEVLITDATAGYVTIGGTFCRAVDFTLQITERVLFAWSL